MKLNRNNLDIKKLLNRLLFVTVILIFSIACKPEIHREYIMEPCPEDEKKSVASLKKQLEEDGFQTFDYVDEETGDTIIMQQYYIAFLKRGANRTESKKEADSLQALHLEHLGAMYEKGYADISGPFGDNQDIRGITIYNVPTLQMADSLANMDPMVQAGWLEIEVRPWWAGKGFPLR